RCAAAEADHGAGSRSWRRRQRNDGVLQVGQHGCGAVSLAAVGEHRWQRANATLSGTTWPRKLSESPLRYQDLPTPDTSPVLSKSRPVIFFCSEVADKLTVAFLVLTPGQGGRWRGVMPL